jgi:hypothetical protein
LLQDEGRGYPANSKPSEISYWQKSHRPWKDQGLRKKTLAEFEAEWWRWWKLLQPESRGANRAEYMDVPTVDMDWTKLRVPGRNGFLLVMVSLTWWGMLCGHSDEWRLAMTDVTVALVCMCAQTPATASVGSTSLKRKRPVLGLLASGSNSPKSPRKLRIKKA